MVSCVAPQDARRDIYPGTRECQGVWSPALTAMDRAHTNIEFNISLSPTGELVTARWLNEKAQAFAVSSTPEAESRSSDITPFPLADSLKYLMQREQNGNLDS